MRETRVRRGWSQEELGDAAKLHRNYVGAIERGEINPTLRTMFVVAKALGVAASELLALAEIRLPEIA